MPTQLFKIKIFFWSLLTLTAIGGAQGFCNDLPNEGEPCYFSQTLFEVKAGYFFLSNSKLRKVYHRGGLDIQLCTSYPMWNLTSRWTLNAYGALEYFYLSGKSINGHEKTSLWSVPINLGVKPVFAVNQNLQYYFALGPRSLYIHQRNHSSFVNKNRSANGVGFFVNTGFNYFLCNKCVIDIFGEYSNVTTHISEGKSRVYTRNIHLTGFTLGAGLGYEF